jgi:predicted DsbA family dithiol-disulfide isomerase
MLHRIALATFIWLLGIGCANGQPTTPAEAPKQSIQPMTVEIWSDVMCPFCYIGKRKFETALAQYAGRDSVTVIWRSFQLNPDLRTEPGKPLAQSLMEQKGWSQQQTDEMLAHVTNMAREAGLEYHFEKAVVANSFDAHRLSHLARAQGRQHEVEERLFAAYFTEGLNTADHATLTHIGTDSGLAAADVQAALAGDAHAADVQADVELARQFGINSVPFFVFDRKTAVSGAQDPSVFLRAMEQAAADR